QVVPDSASNVNIILDPANPQPNWPRLQQNSRVNRITVRNAALNLNDFTLYCNRFAAYDSKLHAGADTGRIINNDITGVGIGFVNSVVNGSMFLSVFNGGVTAQHSKFEGIKILQRADQGNFHFYDSCFVNGDLFIHRPLDAFTMNNLGGIGSAIRSTIIEGDFSCIQEIGGQLHIGPTIGLVGTIPELGVIVKGKLMIKHLRKPGSISGGSLEIYNTKNLTPGGYIISDS